MRIVAHALHGTAPLLARLKEFPGDGVTLIDGEAELADAIVDAELFLTSDNLYTVSVAQTLRERAGKLRWIQLLSAGYDAVARHGVPAGVIITNAGDAFAPSVATHAIALLLGLQRQVPTFHARQLQHVWTRGMGSGNSIPLGQTVAVIGFGHIGRELGRVLKALGARIIAVTRQGQPQPDADETIAVSALHSVLPRADAVMIALAASPESRHLIGARELAAMKRTAFLVNIARGYIVDNMALAEALRAGTIAGAGLDVTEPEPLPRDHPLWDAPNLILTPHMAGASGAVTGERVAAIVSANVARWHAGQPLAHIVPVA